ncbi:hypothetical protein [Novosphingobium album (ex Liu et al. 2023)]|uniref:DUF4235 domain-containing protein n=1 Tax=Novosphingobium album (ex Liu et al. 2023) TaxID=3031130 RepID=A0ABT5WJL7_9SPHN|nr:hypothetical protein [Novosphingobium album (ex Liu et al. 2023)]MDE8650238.1 hypothetical protein [Novosphingobium album (ex Liu et al. 2023)]
MAKARLKLKPDAAVAAVPDAAVAVAKDIAAKGKTAAAKGKAVVAKGKASAAAKIKDSASDLHGPSPNPHTNLVIADIALRGGTMLARRAIERGLLGTKYAPNKAKAILKGRTMSETLLHTAVARVATSSIPGALLVGGGLLAKTLYDRGKARKAKREGEAALQDMAERGAAQAITPGSDNDAED